MGDDRGIAYEEGDNIIYRASGSGTCLTALVAYRLGYQPERSQFAQTTLSNAAKEGNLHEGAIVEELKETYGYRVWGSQDAVELKVIPHVYLRGHIDGFCIPKGARKDRLLEIKTMSKNRFAKWKRLGSIRNKLLSDEFISYGYQISVYMQVTGLQCVYVVKNRDSGEVTIDELKIPPIDYKVIKKKLIQSEMWTKRNKLPPCEATSGDKFFCSFPYLHDDGIFGDEPLEEPALIDNATNVLVAGMAAKYDEVADQVKMMKPLDEERKDLGKKIIQAMGGTDGIKTMVAGSFKVTRVGGSNSRTNNAAVAKKLGITEDAYVDILNNCKEPNPYFYVKVTKVGDK